MHNTRQAAPPNIQLRINPLLAASPTVGVLLAQTLRKQETGS